MGVVKILPSLLPFYNIAPSLSFSLYTYSYCNYMTTKNTEPHKKYNEMNRKKTVQGRGMKPYIYTGTCVHVIILQLYLISIFMWDLCITLYRGVYNSYQLNAVQLPPVVYAHTPDDPTDTMQCMKYM